MNEVRQQNQQSAQQIPNQYQSQQSSGFSFNPLSGQASQTNVNEVRQQNQQSAQQTQTPF
ncbi:hypothetical protein EW027_12580 [Aeribacillus pallidus]|nr:hypothetical protein EW027_12580 [Aeribacillus pallidus]